MRFVGTGSCTFRDGCVETGLSEKGPQPLSETLGSQGGPWTSNVSLGVGVRALNFSPLFHTNVFRMTAALRLAIRREWPAAPLRDAGVPSKSLDVEGETRMIHVTALRLAIRRGMTRRPSHRVTAAALSAQGRETRVCPGGLFTLTFPFSTPGGWTWAGPCPARPEVVFPKRVSDYR